jgi:peptidoglycan hydrolase-like protein with peptidoglycan-binding domain
VTEYRTIQSVGARLPEVDEYGDLTHHHPSKRLAEPTRVYGDVDGRSEELLKDRGTGEPRRNDRGDYFVSKDFILTSNGSVIVPVPSPAAAYVGDVDKRMGSVELWDAPSGTEGRAMIARILHIDAATLSLQADQRVEYGEPLGIQSGQGVSKSGRVANDVYGEHVHIDINTRYLGQLDRYLKDLDAGVITTETRPPPSENVVSPAPMVTNIRDGRGNPVGPIDPLADGVLARGDRGDAVGTLQEQLATLGYTNKAGASLVIDKDFGSGTEHAVKQFQTDKALPVTGIADDATRDAIDRSVRERALGSGPIPPDRELDQRPANGGPRVDPSGRDPMFPSVRDQVQELNRGLGIDSPETADRVAAALTAEWRMQGARGSIDGVVLGQKGTSAQPGEYVFAYSGAPERPNDFVGVRTADAVQTPVEKSFARAQEAVRQQGVEAQQYAQSREQANDAPVRSMG